MRSLPASPLLRGAVLAAVAVFCFLLVAPAKADTTNTMINSPRGLQEALASKNPVNLSGNPLKGFSISGGFLSGAASGNDPLAATYLNDIMDKDFALDHTAGLEGDERVYSLLIDGSYDFNYDFGTHLPLHPYVLGGTGMAMYGTNAPSVASLAQSGAMVPLFRMGGGVTYRLDEKWDLSLDYKAGFATSGDQLFTGRSQQPVDMQVLGMGMRYQF